MFNPILPILAALLLCSTALAGAPSNPNAPPYGLSAAVADTLGPLKNDPDFTPGRCSFEARVDQQCRNGAVKTTLSMLSLKDGAGKSVLTLARGIPVSLDGGVYWHIGGLGQQLRVGFDSGSANYAYGGNTWAKGRAHNSAAFKCEPHGWSAEEELTCGPHDTMTNRTETVSCNFLCAVPNPPSDEDPTPKLNRRAITPDDRLTTPSAPEVLSSQPSLTIEPSNKTEANANYAPGHCSFTLPLFELCVMPDATSFFSLQRIGLLTSIEDDNRRPFLHFANGIGRIDTGAVRLTGFGDGDGLRVAYDPEDSQVYFSFNGNWWSTMTEDDGHANGLCHWGNWGREALKCGEENGPVEYRISDVTCVFKC